MLPTLNRDQKVNLAFGAFATAGAITLATGGAALPFVAAGLLVEAGAATLGAEATKTVLRWIDRRGGKTCYEPPKAD